MSSPAVVHNGGNSLETSMFLQLLQPGVITSPFGQRRGYFHSGIDIAAPLGTIIYASDSGVVTRSGYFGAYGNLVVINHGSGYETYYAHNSTNLVTVAQEVAKYEVIALIGMTGNTAVPHLHRNAIS